MSLVGFVYTIGTSVLSVTAILYTDFQRNTKNHPKANEEMRVQLQRRERGFAAKYERREGGNDEGGKKKTKKLKRVSIT